MRIVINGAGIAGPTLAYWLRQDGHNVLLVEAALFSLSDGGEGHRDRLPWRRPRQTSASAGREGARRARVTPWRRR
jgi:glycine/D-amino acid oxidase-like deaminating enzyme